MKVYDIHYKEQWLGLYASRSDIDKAKKELLDSGDYFQEITLTDITDEYSGAAGHWQEFFDAEPVCVGMFFRNGADKQTGYSL